MVSLLSRISGAKVTTVSDERQWSRLERLGAVVPRQRFGSADVLVVCPVPEHLMALVAAPRWRSGLRRVSAWVIDSWWDDRIPRIAKAARQFDTIFVSEAENIDRWRDATRADVVHLPIGADILANPFDPTQERDIDLLRVGRMPVAWDDDEIVARECTRRGLRFQGRPPSSEDAALAMPWLWSWERRTRFVLAFSNLVSPADYTHPRLEYLTPRWADAWGSGAVTIGALPQTQSSAAVAEACSVKIPWNDLSAGLDAVADLVAQWQPNMALEVRRQAVLHMDWRHRFAVMEREFGAHWSGLSDELDQLKEEERDLQNLIRGSV